MSFSKETKQELCLAEVFTEEQKRAMLYGMVLFSRVFTFSSISCSTESRPTAETYTQLLSEMTETIVDMSVKLTRRGGENQMYTISVPDKNDCAKIYDFFGHSRNQPNLRINRANIDNDECVRYFLRGVFLVCGSVTNPEKDYHLEFVVPHKNLASDLKKIISDADEMNVELSIINRKGSYIVYIKGSDDITDILTYIGGSMSPLTVIQSKMFKSVKNKINRKVNSEMANINRTATASAKQLKAIQIIKEKMGLEQLQSDLRDVAEIRLEHEEYNLREIGQALNISRSGVNHRIQRLLDIADKLSKN